MKYRLAEIVLLSFLVLGFSLNISAQKERQVFPVDEAKKDASFFSFREKLIQAVKNKDRKFLLSILDRDVKGSFGGDSGIEDFKSLWKIDSPQTQLWKELLAVLTNGGKFEKPGREFCGPYSFTHFPEDLDAFEYQMIFGNNVNLRAQPDQAAKVLGQLSYNVVKVDYQNSVQDKNNEDIYTWLKIETLGGRKGFVSAQFVRSPIDYRACFEKIKGKWLMTFFLAGD
jgi:hypothetical protein